MMVGLYARVSTSDQNCEMQVRELREYCARRGWAVAGEHIDAGWSGAKASRPELDRLMANARLRRFDAVVCWKLDRFGRSLVNCVSAIQELTSLGVRFLAVSQGLDTDQANPASQLLLHILAAVAQFERELIRERVTAGVRAARAKGKTLGRPRRVFRRDEVRRLRDDDRLSWRAISKRLGVPVMTVRDAYADDAPRGDGTPVSPRGRLRTP